MKRRDVLLRAALALPAALGLDTKAHAQLEGGIDELTREMGFALELPLRQAVAVTGALLHIALEKLPAVEFSEVTRFLPGAERLMLQAVNEASSALPKTMDGLAPFLEKLALVPETGIISRAFIVSYLRERGGRKVVAALQKAWRV
jgi:hypothetical protein